LLRTAPGTAALAKADGALVAGQLEERVLGEGVDAIEAQHVPALGASVNEVPLEPQLAQVAPQLLTLPVLELSSRLNLLRQALAHFLAHFLLLVGLLDNGLGFAPLLESDFGLADLCDDLAGV
jgi:hypothetical protein